MRIPSLNSNARFTNWKSEINLKFNSILFEKSAQKRAKQFQHGNFEIFWKLVSKIFFFVDLYSDGMRFSKKNSQIKICPRLVKLKIPLNLFLIQKMKTGNGLLREKRRQRIWKLGINGQTDPTEISNECMQTLFGPHEFPAGLPWIPDESYKNMLTDARIFISTTRLLRIYKRQVRW